MMLAILVISVVMYGEAHHGFHTIYRPVNSEVHHTLHTSAQNLAYPVTRPSLGKHKHEGENGSPRLTLSKGEGHHNEIYEDGEEHIEKSYQNVSEIIHHTVANNCSNGNCLGGSVRRTDTNRVQADTNESSQEEILAQKIVGDDGASSLNVLRGHRKPRKTVRLPGRRSSNLKIFVDAGRTSGSLRHFWRSTGLCPPAPHITTRPFLLSQDEKLNLALIGSLPNNAVTQVRIHWLLDLINGSIENGRPQYNFTQLDSLMDLLHQYQLHPGFELMGNPGNIFADLENNTQVLWWRHLVAETASRYVARYGLEWVASWRWETWNEPDHHDFDNLVFTVQGFLNYYDACRAGLDDVSVQLVLGGPGGSCREPQYSRMCWSLLRHCDRGSSYFTPGRPPRIDFISIHKKGQEDADSILTQELLTIQMLRKNYPNLRHVPVINDEGDFLKGWWRGLAWRADARYAALVVRAVYIHLQARVTVPRYDLISFDNAFLNYRPSFFDQRTMMARFQINSTAPRQVQLVKKAAYSVMALLALLGDRSLSYTVRGSDNRLSIISSCRNCEPEAVTTWTTRRHDLQKPQTNEPCPRTTEPPLSSSDAQEHEGTGGTTPVNHTNQLQHRSVIYKAPDHEYRNAGGTGATMSDLDRHTAMANGSWEATVLVSLSNGTEKSTSAKVRVRLSVAVPKFLVGGVVAVTTYRLGAGQAGPYEAWLSLARPVEPTRAQLAFIRSFEGPRRSGPSLVVALESNLHFGMKLFAPDVRVIHLCQTSTSNPGQVIGVRTLGVTSADVLVTWSDARINTRCVLRYEVERSVTGRGGPYSLVSGGSLTLHNNFWYSLPALHGPGTVQGWYRVRVVTYWGTKGAFSPPVYHHVD
ncbi:alpha-L-iduronidase [Panulirus ornatus]|uniref:alpha-L-iduronidase n=1 Tax=Panulirus ornatus TaxID=150431 RepID=UPI003A8374DA